MAAFLIRASALAVCALLASGCGKDDPTVPATPSPAAIEKATTTPDGAISANVHLLKAGDFAALLKSAMPPDEFEKFQAEWTKQASAEPITDEDRAKFDEGLKQFTAPDAEEKLYAEASPKLKDLEAQYKAQIPLYVNMGRGFAQNMIQQSEEFTDEQKRQAIDVVNAVGDWAQSAKFTDQDLLKQAIGIAVRTARALDLKSIDEARALDFDASMKKGQVAYLGVKQLLALYGLSIDETLDSVKPTVLSTSGDSARVKIDYALLGKPLSAESDLVRIDGHWYSKDTLEKLATPPAAEPVDATPAPATQD